MAVDITILDQQGREPDMGTGLADLSPPSHPALEQKMLARGALTAAQIANRELLRGAMFQSGFAGINSEWWHFDCGDRVQRYFPASIAKLASDIGNGGGLPVVVILQVWDSSKVAHLPIRGKRACLQRWKRALALLMAQGQSARLLQALGRAGHSGLLLGPWADRNT
eukprot:gene10274-12594_t